MKPRSGILLGPIAALAAVLTMGLAAPADASDPPNTPPLGLQQCSPTGALTAACLKQARQDFDRARAREGLGRLTLPTNFRRLSVPGQLLVLADIDRVDRGLEPVAGLSRTLQPAAQAGARQSRDPAFPSWTREGGSNWASTASSLWSEYLWMYDDGPGAGNVDCASASSSGCWGHRHNILSHYAGPIMMGAGSDRAGGATELFLGRDDHDNADLVSWAHERRLIPVGVSRRHLAHSGRVKVWASGRSMRIRAKAGHGWHVSRRHCKLRAGHACTVKVSGSGHGTLRLKGPDGRVKVALGH